MEEFKRIAVVIETLIISPHFFLFSEMCLGSELTNSQGIYSNGQIHKIMYDL